MIYDLRFEFVESRVFQCLKEIHRVLKPGGVFGMLEVCFAVSLVMITFYGKRLDYRRGDHPTSSSTGRRWEFSRLRSMAARCFTAFQLGATHLVGESLAPVILMELYPLLHNVHLHISRAQCVPNET